MSTPNEIVTEQLANVNSMVSGFESSLDEWLANFSANLFSNPTIDLNWETVEAPTTLSTPVRPGALDVIEDEFTWDGTGAIAAAIPAPLSIDEPTVAVDTFDVTAPEIDLSGRPALSFPAAPTLTVGDVPEVPEVAAVDIPPAPTLVDVAVPTLLTLTTPTFAGVDTHDTLLTALSNPDTLTLVAPTPYQYVKGAEYSSALLTALKAKLTADLAGGTGLDPVIEAAIWDRDRDRISEEMQQNYEQVLEGSENLGWQLPTGAVAAAARKAIEAARKASAQASRDVAIKQADLEQANLHKVIDSGIQLESKLIDYCWQLEELTFRSAVEVAKNAIEVHNAKIEKFKADLQRLDVLAKAYQSAIDGEKLKIEELRANIALEQAKADVNKALVEQYKAENDARMGTVRIYEALLQGTKTRLEIESVKIQAAGERIRGFVAQVNAKVAEGEIYKVQVSAEGMKADAWATDVKAQLGAVEVYRSQAEAFRAVTGAQVDKARVLLARYEAIKSSKADEWKAWTARVEGERARITSVGQKADALLTGYKVDVAARDAQANQDIARWGAQIKQYEAQQNYTLQGQKLNADIVQANRQVVLDAAKTAAQIFAQLTSSAISRINVSADVRASAGMTVGYQYTGKTSSTVAPVTAI